jgi:hypothetical protein
MPLTTELKYEEQFTAFIDFPGFSEVSRQTDDTTRLKVLNRLLSVSELRAEFKVQSESREGGKVSLIKPAVSTFSDHIVISYPLQPIHAELGSFAASYILIQFTGLLKRIAAAALSLGFLVRGGATIGKLYHGIGVVFGEALVEAVEIESRTSFYPRVVVSRQIASQPQWIDNQAYIVNGKVILFRLL